MAEVCDTISANMWEHYRKFLIPTQLFIIALTATLFFTGRSALGGAIAVFIVMQLGALAGAWWGARLKGKLEDRANRLPLDKR